MIFGEFFFYARTRTIAILVHLSFSHRPHIAKLLNIPSKMCKFHKVINPIDTRFSQPQIKGKYLKHS